MGLSRFSSYHFSFPWPLPCPASARRRRINSNRLGFTNIWICNEDDEFDSLYVRMMVCHPIVAVVQVEEAVVAFPVYILLLLECSVPGPFSGGAHINKYIRLTIIRNRKTLLLLLLGGWWMVAEMLFVRRRISFSHPIPSQQSIRVCTAEQQREVATTAKYKF